MKEVKKLAVLLSLGALLPIAASAKTLEQSYLESCRQDSAVPVPVVVVSPRAAPEFIGKTVDVEFTVDTTGKPSGFVIKSYVDNMVADAVVDAVKQWQFVPAHRNGMAVAKKVLLPVRFVAESLGGTSYAAE